MDTTSIVVSYPALADGGARLQGGRHLPRRSPITKQPNPLDSVSQSYQGGAVVALDFTPEGGRPKAARSTCPTTT